MKYCNSQKYEAGGAAIILVVWVMVILVAIVGEFSYSMRTEIDIIRNFKEEEEAYQMALAGIETAKMEIILSEKEQSKVYLNDEGILLFVKEEDGESERKGTLGKGNFEYIIIDEDSKININKAASGQMKYVFEESGVDISDVDTIVDSIEDWRDRNELHHLNGAEEDYYRSLANPYSCKDGKFDALEELLLVKGMTNEIFNGSKVEEDEDDDEEEKDYKGVKQYLTVFDSEMININTATTVVLEAVFGIEIANSIIQQREDGPISNPIRGGKISSSFFTIVSTGTNTDGTIKRSVKAVIHKKNNTVETVFWSDNVIG